MKHIYKFFALFLIFGLSIFLFRKMIPEASAGTSSATTLQTATFPIMYLEIGNGYTVNTLHGYSSELNSSNVRECITPLEADKSFIVKFKENQTKVKKLTFNLKDITNNKVIESDTLTAFDNKKGLKTLKIKLSESIDTSTEYGMDIVLTTNLSKKIHYYTRIKYYDTDFFLKQKLEFVTGFHNATFNPGKSFKYAKYLESNTSTNKSYANVGINSSPELVTWGKLKPKLLSETIPTIKEVNVETAAIQYVYYVRAKTSSGSETFLVKEFYRVRYSGSRLYLLNFRRTMEAVFNPKLTSVRKSQFKIGVSNESNFQLTLNDKANELAFVRNGSLWYYDMDKDNLHEVFSFAQKKTDYLRDTYDQHNIKILNFDDNNTINFVVYGYMNCGDYEGRVAVILYNYDPAKNLITERVYIPLETTYQQLKEDFGKYCYVNKQNIFYFSMNNVMYAYNISSKKYELLTKNIAKDNFSMMEDAKCFVWSNASKSDYSQKITILNLDTANKLEVTAPENQSIVVLGTIDANVVYGFVKNKDIYEGSNGETIQPAYKLVISDCNGNIMREYKNKNIYVISATVENNVITLKRVRKTGNAFKPTNPDSILNQKKATKKTVHVASRITKQSLAEKYICLPSGYKMKKTPEIQKAKHVMVTENTTLHLADESSSSFKYYIYAYGEVTASFTTPAKAIQKADEQMGVVMDNRSHVVWERGGKFISKEVSGMSYPDTADSKKAAVLMLLQAAQSETDESSLKGSSIMSMLKTHIKQPADLTGCTLDEVLYFVSSGKPVIGMLSDSHAVVITGYTTSTVTWLDPVTHKKNTTSLTSAEHTFKDAGYRFASYM